MSLAATMPTLPEELLALIFEQLASPSIFEVDAQMDVLYEQDKRSERSHMMADHSARIGTLRNICLASKSMHRLAWPVLYREFSNRQTADFEDKGLEPGYETPTRRLLRTICLTPHYGPGLRNLLIRAWTPIEAMRGEQIFDLLQSDATVSALFQWRARGFYFHKPEFVDSLHRALSLGHEDGLLTLLLIMCPKIRELEFEPPIDFDQSLFISLLGIVHGNWYQKKSLPAMEPDFEQEEADYIIAQMFGTPWPDQKWQMPLFLNSLSKLTLWNPGLDNLDIECIAQILLLPSLRTLKAHGMNYRGNKDNVFYTFLRGSERNHKCSKLRSLELHCISSTDTLSALLVFCPFLEELTVIWEDFDEEDANFCLDYEDIADTLKMHIPDLRKLTLDASQGWRNSNVGPDHAFTIGWKLGFLKKLEHLTLDTDAVYGSQYANLGSNLGANVPKGVTNLTLVSGHWDPENEQAGLYHDRQDEDLIAFLQDPTFDRLSNIQLTDCKYLVTEVRAAAKKHGWKILPQLPDEIMRLVNPSRTRTESASTARIA